jgi:L-ascorbate metabolism protein UlaG (beta-lactamase superfamily)
MVTVRWLGVAGLEIRMGDSVLLVDPYLSRPNKFHSLLTRVPVNNGRVDKYLASIPGKVVGMLAGHTHSDHVLDFPRIVEKTGVTAYGTRSLRRLFSAYGIEEKAGTVTPGVPVKIGPFEALPIESVHGKVLLGKIPFQGEIQEGLKPPLWVWQYRHGGPLIWIIKAGDVRILHLSSADYVLENLKGVTADVAFLCASGRQYTPDFSKNLIEAVRPKKVVPFHFEDFSAPLAPTGEAKMIPGVDLPGFVAELKAALPEGEVIVPEPLTDMEF